MLISTADLEDLVLRQNTTIVLLDVRWKLGQSEQENLANYLDGHIPSALRVDVDHELAAPASPEEGRHPLPAPETWAAQVREWGIHNNSRIVVYDESGGAAAARAWWMLRWAGLTDITILNGGWQAWASEGRHVAVGPGNPHVHGTFTFSESGPAMPSIDIEAAATWPSHGILLDARSHERYTGRSHNQIDRRLGHIPGALSMPSEDLITPELTFRTPEEIREKLAARGVSTPEDAKRVAAYCGSGVTAAHLIFAMELAGLPGASLFAGSWSQWAADVRRPVEIGDAHPAVPVG